MYANHVHSTNYHIKLKERNYVRIYTHITQLDEIELEMSIVKSILYTKDQNVAETK